MRARKNLCAVRLLDFFDRCAKPCLLSPPLAALAGFAPYEKNHGTQTFEKEELYAVILESMLTFETVIQRFAERHKPLSYSGVFKDFSSGKRVKSLPLRGQSPQTEKSQHTSCRKQQLICCDFGAGNRGRTCTPKYQILNRPAFVNRKASLSIDNKPNHTNVYLQHSSLIH